MALAGAAAAADAIDSSKLLLVSFGSNAGNGVATKTGSFMETSGLTYNVISTGSNSGYTTGTNALKWADNTTATGFSINTGQAVSGSNGQVNTITKSELVNETFDTSTMNAVGNYDDGVAITLSGLSVGKSYTIYTFVGRGNDYGGTAAGDTNTYTISVGAKDVVASVVSYTLTTPERPAPSVSEDGTSITAYTQSCDGVNQTCENWAILSFDFTATASSVKLAATGSGCGNFGAIALSVPEPTTATLSLLALVGLAARRRRR